MRLRHLAIHVPDLRSAEAYYLEIFDLAVTVREGARARGGPGDWAQLPPDKGWAHADAAGIEIGMIALARDEFVLALFPGQPSPGQVFAVGVVMSEMGIADVASRIPDDTLVLASEPTWLEFIDRHQLHWQLTPSTRFVGAGDSADRWLDG
jgi:catechol 2,3-dioxygenase-like lactoylglutathione lyase family enzyme